MSDPKPNNQTESAQEMKRRIYDRIHGERQWSKNTSELRDKLYGDAKDSGMTKDEALVHTYTQLDELIPPLPIIEPEIAEEKTGENGEGDVNQVLETSDSSGSGASEPRARAKSDPTLTGLADIPADWPQLPPNAPLSAEILWVQASRLDVVTELPGGSIEVDLSKADRPAPSKAAIGWLETAIRSFTKFCDIAAKATAQLDDDGGEVRREKMAIEEVRSILGEMLENG